MESKVVFSAIRFFASVIALGVLAIVSFVLGLLVQRERMKELAAELRRVKRNQV
jgi:hypothetical protein